MQELSQQLNIFLAAVLDVKTFVLVAAKRSNQANEKKVGLIKKYFRKNEYLLLIITIY